MDIDGVYNEVLMEHYDSPYGSGKLARVDVVAQGANPICGDEVEIQLQIDGGRISGVRVIPRGCVISVASASMMAAIIENRPVADLERIIELFKRYMRGDDSALSELRFEDLEALKGVRKLPMRVKCALLPYTTLELAFKKLNKRSEKRS